ncbi:hypothetical protein CAEBREN_07657 [Caenorhabditis brenneri]|uniref:Uncharacterized protein n=1 Tax=Caenorhabditis brenneri TaxID=135651 RepID=G0P2U5_CAEBE|nr:hypothetical protein CAEBREN_07657 [Caenorhabditis brenneri]
MFFQTQNSLQSQLITQQEAMTEKEEAHFLEKKQLKQSLEKTFSVFLGQTKRHWGLQKKLSNAQQAWNIEKAQIIQKLLNSAHIFSNFRVFFFR